MLAWMDDEALHRTLTTGRATYWSRSRREYWVKGETSGHHQYVRSVALDCDGDALLVTRRPGRRGLPHRRPHLLLRPSCRSPSTGRQERAVTTGVGQPRRGDLPRAGRATAGSCR